MLANSLCLVVHDELWANKVEAVRLVSVRVGDLQKVEAKVNLTPVQDKNQRQA